MQLKIMVASVNESDLLRRFDQQAHRHDLRDGGRCQVIDILSAGRAHASSAALERTRHLRSSITFTTMADVEMKPVEEKKKDEEKKVGEEKDKSEEKKLPPTVQEEIKTNVILIERAVSTLEPRFTLRVLRMLTALRKRLTEENLVGVIGEVYPAGACCEHCPKVYA